MFSFPNTRAGASEPSIKNIDDVIKATTRSLKLDDAATKALSEQLELEAVQVANQALQRRALLKTSTQGWCEWLALPHTCDMLTAACTAKTAAAYGADLSLGRARAGMAEETSWHSHSSKGGKKDSSTKTMHHRGLRLQVMGQKALRLLFSVH